MIDENKPAGTTRRTVAKGAAWSVPAVMTLAAAPAQAASPGQVPPPPAFDWNDACKNPGSSGKGCGPKQSYQVPVTVNNPGTEPVIIAITGFIAGGTPLGVAGICNISGNTCATSCPGLRNTVCIAPGGTVTFTPYSTTSGSSTNLQFTVSYQFYDANCAKLGNGGSGTSPTTPPSCGTSTPAPAAVQSSTSSASQAPASSATTQSAAPATSAASQASAPVTSAPVAPASSAAAESTAAPVAPTSGN